MNTFKDYIGYFLLLIITGCTPTIRTIHTSNYEATPANISIKIYELNENPPTNVINIGTIKIGDSGFSVDCGWNKVLDEAKKECRKIGGDAIKLVVVKTPDFNSTCFRLTAYALRSPGKQFLSNDDNKSDWTEEKIKAEWAEKGIDEIEGIYEKIGDGKSANYTLAIKKKNSLEYEAIYLAGELEPFSSKWSEGDIKARLIKTATPYIYKVEWYMDDKSIQSNLYISFIAGLMKTIWSENRMEEAYLKLFPTQESEIKRIDSNKVSSGTGFAINNQGYIVTNYHVVENSDSLRVKGLSSDFNKEYKAKVAFIDRNNDLAIIKIDDKSTRAFETPPYRFKSSLSEVGESVFALGYPLVATMGDEIKLTNGIISSKSGFQGDITNYQISVPVQPGNSGGPLFDKQGNVIGIISAKHKGAENATYAIKASYLINMLNSTGEKIELNNVNNLIHESLPNQVKKIKSFVYIIECN